MLVRQLDVEHAVEKAFDGSLGPRARERRARAGVDAVSEREVLATVRSVEAELVWALERARVAIGGAREHHDGVTGADTDAGESVV